MKSKTILAATVLAAATLPSLMAQPGEGRKGKRPPHPVVAALDADGDHTLSASEIENAATALAALDLNRDGNLTRREMLPERVKQKIRQRIKERRNSGDSEAEAPRADREKKKGKKKAARRRAHPILDALDTDGDRKISSAEMSNAPASLRALDANGDGSLTRGEASPKRCKKK